jgi:hypothetical protein
MANRITSFLVGEVSPIIWLLLLCSALIGLFFLTGWFVSSTESVLYNTGVLVAREVWGAVLLASSVVGMVGCAKHNTHWIKFSGAVGWLAWLFACIGLGLAGHWYLLLTVYGVHLIFHLLLYLGAHTGVIFREPVYRR